MVPGINTVYNNIYGNKATFLISDLIYSKIFQKDDDSIR